MDYLFDRIDDAPENNLNDSSIKFDDVVSRIMKLGTTTTQQELRFQQFLEKYGNQKWKSKRSCHRQKDGNQLGKRWWQWLQNARMGSGQFLLCPPYRRR